MPRLPALALALCIPFLSFPSVAASEWDRLGWQALTGALTGTPDPAAAAQAFGRAEAEGSPGASTRRRLALLMGSPAAQELARAISSARAALAGGEPMARADGEALDAAAVAGLPEARRLAGMTHALGRREDASPALGLAMLRAARADGDAAAAVSLAVLHELSGAAPQDVLEAWEAAEAMGHPQARRMAAFHRASRSPRREAVAAAMSALRAARAAGPDEERRVVSLLREAVPHDVLSDAEVLLAPPAGM